MTPVIVENTVPFRPDHVAPEEVFTAFSTNKPASISGNRILSLTQMLSAAGNGIGAADTGKSPSSGGFIPKSPIPIRQTPAQAEMMAALMFRTTPSTPNVPIQAAQAAAPATAMQTTPVESITKPPLNVPEVKPSADSGALVGGFAPRDLTSLSSVFQTVSTTSLTRQLTAPPSLPSSLSYLNPSANPLNSNVCGLPVRPKSVANTKEGIFVEDESEYGYGRKRKGREELTRIRRSMSMPINSTVNEAVGNETPLTSGLTKCAGTFRTPVSCQRLLKLSPSKDWGVSTKAPESIISFLRSRAVLSSAPAQTHSDDGVNETGKSQATALPTPSGHSMFMPVGVSFAPTLSSVPEGTFLGRCHSTGHISEPPQPLLYPSFVSHFHGSPPAASAPTRPRSTPPQSTYSTWPNPREDCDFGIGIAPLFPANATSENMSTNPLNINISSSRRRSQSSRIEIRSFIDMMDSVSPELSSPHLRRCSPSPRTRSPLSLDEPVGYDSNSQYFGVSSSTTAAGIPTNAESHSAVVGEGSESLESDKLTSREALIKSKRHENSFAKLRRVSMCMSKNGSGSIGSPSPFASSCSSKRRLKEKNLHMSRRKSSSYGSNEASPLKRRSSMSPQSLIYQSLREQENENLDDDENDKIKTDFATSLRSTDALNSLNDNNVHTTDNNTNVFNSGSGLDLHRQTDLWNMNENNFRGVIIGGIYGHYWDGNMPTIVPNASTVSKRVVGVHLREDGALLLRLYVPFDRAVKLINLGVNWVWLPASPEGYLVSKQSLRCGCTSVSYYLCRHPMEWARDDSDVIVTDGIPLEDQNNTSMTLSVNNDEHNSSREPSFFAVRERGGELMDSDRNNLELITNDSRNSISSHNSSGHNFSNRVTSTNWLGSPMADHETDSFTRLRDDAIVLDVDDGDDNMIFSKHDDFVSGIGMGAIHSFLGGSVGEDADADATKMDLSGIHSPDLSLEKLNLDTSCSTNGDFEDVRGSTADVSIPDWTNHFVVTSVLEFLADDVLIQASTNPLFGSSANSQAYQKIRNRKAIVSSLESNKNMKIFSVCKSWAMGCIRIVSKYRSNVKNVPQYSYEAWKQFMSKHNSGKFLSDGSCKQVYRVHDIEGNVEAISVMDINDMNKRGMEEVIAQEIEISLLCSGLNILNICPNVLRMNSIFVSKYPVPRPHWYRSKLNNKQRITPVAVPNRTELTTGNYQYIRMEFCSGGDLEAHLKSNAKKITLDDVRNYLFQIFFSVYCCREQLSMRHYDIKLLNFLIASTDSLSSTSCCTVQGGNNSNLNGDNIQEDSVVEIRYGFGDIIFALYLASDNAGVVKLSDFGTSCTGLDDIGTPITSQQVTYI